MIWRLVVRGALLLLAALLVVAMGARHLRPTPDLVAVVVGVVALRGGLRSGLGVGLAGGWLLDLLPPGSAVLGTSALTYAVAGALAGTLHRPGPASWLLVALAAGVAGACVTLIGVLAALARSAPVNLPGVLASVAATATIGLLLGPLLLRLDARWGRRA